jgi:hypothetical protein
VNTRIPLEICTITTPGRGEMILAKKKEKRKPPEGVASLEVDVELTERH